MLSEVVEWVEETNKAIEFASRVNELIVNVLFIDRDKAAREVTDHED